MGSKYRGGFSLLVPLWDDGIQFSTWRRANALAHDDGMFTSVDLHLMGMYVCMFVCMFSLLGPLWNDGIQLSTWRRANALAHDDGMFTLWTTPDGNVCMYVYMYVCMCETCGERFSRQQDIARHKCSSSSRTTSSAKSQTK